MKSISNNWITILGGIIATTVTLTAYAFTNFQTKDAAKEYIHFLEERLDRLENKIDNLSTFVRQDK